MKRWQQLLSWYLALCLVFAGAVGITLDADFSLSHSEFRDNPRDRLTGQHIGDRIPGSIESVIAAGITYHNNCGFFGSLRLRYFGPRPLI